MTLWKNLVVTLVAAFALAACSSSDSGPSQADLDAEKARADAAEERADQAEAERDKLAAEKAEEEAATAPAATLQVNASDDELVTATRNSSGKLVTIMVGDTSVSLTSRSQHVDDISVSGTDYGASYQNGGIEVSHAGAYVPMVIPVGFKHIDGNDNVNDGLEIPIVEALNLTDFDERDGAPLPSNVTVVEVTQDNTKPRFETRSGTGHVAITGGFDVDADPQSIDELLFYRVAVDADSDGVTDEDGLGVAIFDYYIKTLNDGDTQTTGAQPLYLKLDLVEVEGDTAIHAKKADDFQFLSYGAWADADAKGNLTDAGDGYLSGATSDYTPIANMPVTGKATYQGQYVGYLKKRGSVSRVEAATGDMTAVANFSRDSMLVTLMDHEGASGDIELSGKLSGNSFTGTGVDFQGSSSINGDGATADLAGQFFGSEAEEVGGVYEIVGGASRNPGRIAGAFGAASTD